MRCASDSRALLGQPRLCKPDEHLRRYCSHLTGQRHHDQPPAARRHMAFGCAPSDTCSVRSCCKKGECIGPGLNHWRKHAKHRSLESPMARAPGRSLKACPGVRRRCHRPASSQLIFFYHRGTAIFTAQGFDLAGVNCCHFADCAGKRNACLPSGLGAGA